MKTGCFYQAMHYSNTFIEHIKVLYAFKCEFYVNFNTEILNALMRLLGEFCRFTMIVLLLPPSADCSSFVRTELR